MKTTILVFLLFTSFIYSQNIDFSLNAVDEQNLYDHSRNIANSSMLWLAGNINTPKSSGKTLYIKYSQSSLLKKINNNHWVLPNFQFGLMLSNNLMLSGNFFGMHLKKDILQISGGGIHYLGGEKQDWVVSFQKSALNGLNDFRLVSTSLSINKRFKKSFYYYFLGIGSCDFSFTSYFDSSELPKKFDRNSTYLKLEVLIPYKDFDLTFSSNISSKNQLLQLGLAKGF
tara:strand:+ start:207 stop:890 length:684 start_codon:yes stop_codon:yes gene_type:complete